MLNIIKGVRPAGILRLAAAILAVGFASLSASVSGEEPAPAPSLYQRVGGYDFIAKFVDTAFPRVAGHPQLKRLFQGHSVDSQLRQRQLIVDALCAEMGGPCIYIGRPMKPLHEGLGITGSDWAVFMEIIESALIELDVSESERRDWLRLFNETFRPGIVEVG
jgi:hemoglobin